MNTRSVRSIFVRWLCLLALGVMLLPLPAHAESGETIRVGQFTGKGYHTVNGSNVHSGYDYAYLQEIAKYTGWRYEFVEGSWQECVDMLENGEIDLLGGVDRHTDRLATMRFASVPSAYASNCLVVDRQSTRYAYEDFAAFDGMRVGMLAGSVMERELKAYSQEHNFSYTLTRYGTEEELERALSEQKIDCICMTDFRDLSRYNIIARFGDTQLYYATSTRRSDLIADLNSALDQIHTVDRFYEYDLYNTYFSSALQAAFTPRESEYIKTHSRVPVALFQDLPMVCEYDPETQQYKGIAIDVLDEISARSGLQFDYLELEQGFYPWNYVESHPNTLLAPLLYNSTIDYGNEMTLLTPMVSCRMIAVSRTYGSGMPEGSFTLAIPEDMYKAGAAISELFPTSEIITCPSHQEGIDMVHKGKADITLVNEVTGAYMLKSPYYRDLQTMYLDDITEDITIALSHQSDPLLISILSKTIASLDSRDISRIMVQNTVDDNYPMTTGEQLYQYRSLLLVLALMLVGGIVLYCVSQKQKKAHQEEQLRLQLAEERLKAEDVYKKELFRQANYDALTGLYNEAYFISQANVLLREHPDVVYSFFRINIENFKLINEVYGTKRGDLVLIQVAKKLAQELGSKGIYGRVYADQFVACYPLDHEIPVRIHDQNVLHLNCDGQIIRIQMNVGVYINRQHSMDAAQIIDYTLIALQHRDKSANEHVCYYQDAYLDRMLRQQMITNEMEHALQDGQFHIFLQPQFDIPTKKLVGAEALVRWFHPEKGIIPPNEFIPVFEANRFIYQLDSYVCQEVCRLLAKWKEQGTLIPISINLSRVDLNNPLLTSMLQSALDKYGVPIQYLHLEITESAYVENQTALNHIIENLRKVGFCIEMDDFGSGYSSLNMLKDVPVDVVKMDMKFFSGETHMDKGGNIIEAVVKLAHSLGALVVAEGVETEREANFLRSIQCHLAQGYLYGRPIPVEEFEQLMAGSPTLPKMQVLDGQAEDVSDSLYWALEKYNALQRSVDAILFDYDPINDYALFSYRDQIGDPVERGVSHYTKQLMNDPLVHPDYRNALKDSLLDAAPGSQDLEFLADYLDHGSYEWFQAEVYHYRRNGALSRVIGIIQKK